MSKNCLTSGTFRNFSYNRFYSRKKMIVLFQIMLLSSLVKFARMQGPSKTLQSIPCLDTIKLQDEDDICPWLNIYKNCLKDARGEHYANGLTRILCFHLEEMKRFQELSHCPLCESLTKKMRRFGQQARASTSHASSGPAPSTGLFGMLAFLMHCQLITY